MLKKSLSLLLALVMCLALVPMTALAGDLSGYYWAGTYEVTGFWGEIVLNEVENTASNSTVTGTFADGAGTITGVATGSGFSGKWSNSVNGTSGQILLRGRTYQQKDSTGLTVEWKYDTGADTSWHNETGVLIPTVPATPQHIMQLNKTAYAPGETITVTVADITQQMHGDQASVGIYKKGSAHDAWGEYHLPKVTGDVLTFTAPVANGEYEMRLYRAYHSEDYAAAFVFSVPFTVGSSTPQPTTPGTPPTIEPAGPVTPITSSFTATAIDSGVKLGWSTISGALGYRVYRSTTSGVEGISITDFALTGTSFVDVNVDANTTYYYTLRALLKEANAVTGERETLGNPSAQVSVKTGATILGGNASDMGSATKNVILMKLNDPNMSVNGLKQEIDPGRGTTPQSMNGRTMVPIRAIIEAMGGTVGWEDATSKIMLAANGHSVAMWLNKKDLTVDGASKAMDVAPVSVNGRTMVPVRFAAENVGCVVDWIGSTSEIVVVYYTGGTPAGVTTPTTPTQPTQPTTPAQPTTPTPAAGISLADAKANAQAAGHGTEAGYAAHTGDDFPKVKDGFYVIYKNNHDYDNIMVFELDSAADAKKYAESVQKAIESAKVRYYDRFVVEIAIVDKAVRPTFTDDMAKDVMKDLFKTEGTAA